MPTYEYKREDGTIFDYIQGMNDEPLTTCPETGQPVKRIISGGGGVIYKGDGWYVTDYKNNGKNGAAGADNDNSKAAETTPESKSSSSDEKPKK